MAKATTKPAQAAPAETAIQRATPTQAATDLEIIENLDGYEFGNLVNTPVGSIADTALALRENLGGGNVNIFDFTRIKLPAGGMQYWELIDIDSGETSAEKSFDGVLTFWTDQKAYWAKGLDAKDAQRTPPDCFSTDTVKGIGSPGVMCANCAFNKFGTAKDNTGKGKACKDVRHLLICRPGDALPILLPAPPKSLKPLRQYLLNLAGRSIPYWAAVTRFSIKKESSGGNDFGIIVPRLVGVLTGDAYAGAQKMKNIMQTLVGSRPLTERGDADGVASGPSGSTAGGGNPTPAPSGQTANASTTVSGGGASALGDDDDAPMSTSEDAEIIDAEVSDVPV